MIEVDSLKEISGQLTRHIAIGVGDWCAYEKQASDNKIDMNWIRKEDIEKLNEIMDWCGEKYSKQYDVVISEHVQKHKANSYRKWFDVRLSFKDPNAALEFKMVWG